MMATPQRRTASVVWELSQEGTVVVDVDAPVRPFGEVPLTPPRGTPMGAAAHPRASPQADSQPADHVEGKRRTLPPLPVR